ncbi:sucrose phosphatase [Anabaena cylindrica PCC 7122]|nr:sucrose phosphatase [Anabaena cylindrica PCC 7122]
MQFLRQRWKFAAKQTVVCSDLGNDIALFAVSNERGIMSGMLTKGYSYDTINIVTSHKTFVLGGLWKVLNILGS